MGRFKHLEDFPVGIEGFRVKYYIPQGVGLQYCPPDQILTNREEGKVVIPMTAFIKGGMTLSIGRITRDYLLNHRLCPLNDQMNLGLTWHDVIHMYECHSLTNAGFYLKSRSTIVRMVSCLPKSNKGMKDDYLIVSREWHDDLHCPTQEGELGSLGRGFSPFSFTSFHL